MRVSFTDNFGDDTSADDQVSFGDPTGRLLDHTSRATGSAAALPNATNGAGLTFGSIAQTKYGAPAGWSTPVGDKAEGVLWSTPWGTTVAGSAPDVFSARPGDGVSTTDAADSPLAAAVQRITAKDLPTAPLDTAVRVQNLQPVIVLAKQDAAVKSPFVFQPWMKAAAVLAVVVLILSTRD
jgi:hypothetical protein